MWQVRSCNRKVPQENKPPVRRLRGGWQQPIRSPRRIVILHRRSWRAADTEPGLQAICSQSLPLCNSFPPGQTGEDTGALEIWHLAAPCLHQTRLCTGHLTANHWQRFPCGKPSARRHLQCLWRPARDHGIRLAGSPARSSIICRPHQMRFGMNLEILQRELKSVTAPPPAHRQFLH